MTPYDEYTRTMIFTNVGGTILKSHFEGSIREVELSQIEKKKDEDAGQKTKTESRTSLGVRIL